ncbi:MAG: non-heme iron oxygenase ferredoxin subunit [bacterium]|nr:non-heme iron oxygenase ferredoxin subunit [bacterium]
MSWQRIEIASEGAQEASGAPLGPGEKRAVRVGDQEILVLRVDDEYFAVSNRCTHAAWPLTNEPLDGMEIVCTLHGARFDVRDGCPTGGPASKPLATHPIELRDGELYVRF